MRLKHLYGLLGSSIINASKCFAVLGRPEWSGRYIGNLKGLVEDGLEQFHTVLAAKRWEAGDHFIDDAP